MSRAPFRNAGAPSSRPGSCWTCTALYGSGRSRYGSVKRVFSTTGCGIEGAECALVLRDAGRRSVVGSSVVRCLRLRPGLPTAGAPGPGDVTDRCCGWTRSCCWTRCGRMAECCRMAGCRRLATRICASGPVAPAIGWPAAPEALRAPVAVAVNCAPVATARRRDPERIPNHTPQSRDHMNKVAVLTAALLISLAGCAPKEEAPVADAAVSEAPVDAMAMEAPVADMGASPVDAMAMDAAVSDAAPVDAAAADAAASPAM